MEKIPMMRSFVPSFEEYCHEIRPLWDSRMLTNMGKLHKSFEEQLTAYLGVSQVSLFANGHLALEMTLQALHLYGEVITTPYTFVSTTHAIARSNLTPVFCDIREDDFTIDPEQIEERINKNTVAIVPVHVYGNVCDVHAIDRIAKKHGLKVIYDAAHAFGVRYQGRGIGNFGDASMFSFHATKPFHSVEGGAVTFDDPALGQILYDLKNFGIHNTESVEGIGANAKMSEFHAAMGLCNLRHIDAIIEHGRGVAERYNSRLRQVPGLYSSCWQENPDVQPNYAYYPLIVDETKFGRTRDELMAVLAEADILTRKYFYPLISDLSCYRNIYSSGRTPVAQTLSRRVLTLPMFSELEDEDVDRICDVIEAATR